MRNDLLKGIDGEISRMEGLLDELSGLREMTTGSARCASSRSRWPSGCRSCLPPGGRPPRTLGWQDDIPTDLPIVRIDPARLGQAFGNLLSNAVKYTSAGGKVRVSVGLEGAGWHLQVADRTRFYLVLVNESECWSAMNGGSSRKLRLPALAA